MSEKPKTNEETPGAALGLAAKLLPLAIRIVASCFLSGWVLLLWLGIDCWLTGIQQQVDGSRASNSFPYEEFGKGCVQGACVWGFVSAAALAAWCLGSARPCCSTERDPPPSRLPIAQAEKVPLAPPAVAK